jgi:hypothetical protein
MCECDKTIKAISGIISDKLREITDNGDTDEIFSIRIGDITDIGIAIANYFNIDVDKLMDGEL